MRILKPFFRYALYFIALLVAIFTLGVMWPLKNVEPIHTTTPIVINDVSIVDVQEGTLIPHQSVLIADQHIISIGQAHTLAIPETALQVDGRNRFLIPSLWDMHTHIYKVTPLLDMPLYISYGVTNVRDLTSCPKQGDPFLPCPEDLKQWSQLATEHKLVGPRIQGTTSWMLNGSGIHNQIKDLPDFFGAADAQQARNFVRYYKGKVDAIKVYDHISRDAYFAVADEAKKLGMDVIGHRPLAVSAIEAATHQKSIEHARFILHESFSGSTELRSAAEKGEWKEDRQRMLDEHDPALANEIFTAMKDAGTWYVPTHLTRRVDAYGEEPLILEDPLLRYLHPLMKWQWLEDVNKTIDEDPSPQARQTYREFYKKGLELTGAAHKAGVKILAGTDYIVAGATVHDELQQLVQAGLSPAEALKAATLSPAEYFSLTQDYGQVKEGLKADLVLLNKNPLDDIRNSASIESVIFNGNFYDRHKLDNIESIVEQRTRSWTIGCKILWEFIKNPGGY
ncbi:MAG: amidohydrolase family protein [Cellvibrio sp.]|uniref:amidohydrolase family protein n=1 Tax=Cellvibrio sp. TaxID=1965322 RepID=UPI0031A42692